MRKIERALLALALLASAAAPTRAGTPAGVPARVGANPPEPYFADPAFQHVWERSDYLVAQEQVPRSWYWGPVQDSGPLIEPYAEGDGGGRLVEYFDKSRMEINHPGGNPSDPFYVTNGLLTVELMTGRVQTGDHGYADNPHSPGPAQINLAGDPSTSAPTYASFAPLTDVGPNPPAAADQTGQPAIARIAADGSRLPDDPAKAADPQTTIASYDDRTHHNIPRAFWEYLNASGAVTGADGATQTGQLNDPWYYASGHPISEAYWTQVTITNHSTRVPELRDVLIQAFQRRVLTYTPGNDPAYLVEMGNIGQHYLQWRYGAVLPGQATIYDRQNSGGVICRAGTPPGGPCPSAELAPRTANHAAYYDDTIETNIDGTLNAMTAADRFRLLPSSHLQLKRRADLSAGELFILGLGQMLNDHRNAAGEIEIDTGNARIQPIDTEFSVSVRADKSVEVAVVAGPQGVVITSSTGTTLVLGAAQQVQISAAGAFGPSEPFDPETSRLWDIYARDGNLAAAVPLAARLCPPTARLYPPRQDAVATRLGCPVTPVQQYSSGIPSFVAFYKAGLLLYAPGKTSYVYALATQPQPPSWDLFAFPGATADEFLKLHPALADALGAPAGECAAAPWAIQEFAGGTVIQPPGPGKCGSLAPVRLVLYADGTWTEVPGG